MPNGGHLDHLGDVIQGGDRGEYLVCDVDRVPHVHVGHLVQVCEGGTVQAEEEG